MKIAPNPANSSVNISWSPFKDGNGEVAIYDLMGKKVKSYPVSTGQGNLVIDVSSLNAGVYFVRLLSGGGEVGREKLVVVE